MGLRVEPKEGSKEQGPKLHKATPMPVKKSRVVLESRQNSRETTKWDG